MQQHIRKSRHKELSIGCIICTVSAFFYCYEFILRIIPGILQAEIRSALGHISAATFGQMSALYYVAYSPMQLPVGILMDRFGAKRLLFFACLCCASGALLFSYPIIMFASLGRLIVGFGSAFAFVGVLNCAVNWLPQRYFSLVAGLITTVSMLSLVYGEIEITRLNNYYGLHTVLQLTAVMGLLLSVMIVLLVRDNPSQSAKYHQDYAVFFKQVFLVLKSPAIWIIGIIGACLYTSLSVFGELWSKSFLEVAFHLNTIQAAKTTSLLFLGWGVGAPLCGYISDRSQNRWTLLRIGSVGALLCITAIVYCHDLDYRSLNILVFGYGVLSSVEITVFIMAKEYSANQQLSGTIFAVTNMIISLGGMVFQPLVGKVIDYSPGTLANIHSSTGADYQRGLALLPIIMLVVVLITIFVPKYLGSKNRQ